MTPRCRHNIPITEECWGCQRDQQRLARVQPSPSATGCRGAERKGDRELTDYAIAAAIAETSPEPDGGRQTSTDDRRAQSGAEECRAIDYGGGQVWCERGDYGSWRASPCADCPERGQRSDLGNDEMTSPHPKPKDHE